MAPWIYTCEDGCEHLRSELQGTSIYGPDEVAWCVHPANESNSCRICPRKAMTAEELIADLFEALATHSAITLEIESLIERFSDEQRARDRGTPYAHQELDTPAKIIDQLRELLRSAGFEVKP